ncbi:MAG: energy-coupling factor transporter transmembrane protein EcfT [Deltaproteobacteria bacterium]|nr:energy-coupling factor transporter transmembrane protein EcfT [Deltaproteobacteria bacterium]
MEIATRRYSAKKTPLHRIDTRVKILLIIAFSAAVFSAGGALLGTLALLVFAALLVAGLDYREVWLSLKPALPIFILIVALHALVDREGGVLVGLLLVCRFSLLLLLSTVFIRTSSPLEITTALEFLLSPLQILRLPVNALAQTLALAIRFLPLLLEEMSQIAEAQHARGARLPSVRFTQRMKQARMMAGALIGGSITRAEGIAEGLVARGYCLEGKRSRLCEPQLRTRDYCWAALAIGILVVTLW